MTTIFYNNRTDRALTREIVRLIKSSRVWIKACNLFFDDPNIREALIDALKRGVAVFILTSLVGSTDEAFTNKDSGKRKSAEQTTQNMMHAASLDKLYNSGAHISGLDGLHAKFLLTDNGSGMITSLNFSPNSTNTISELGIKIQGREFDELEEIFDHIFIRPDQYQFASHGSHFTYERPSEYIDQEKLSRRSHIKMTLASTRRGSGNALADCDIHDLRDEIFDIINTAESGDWLYVATYSLLPDATDANRQALHEALLNATRRGVNLKVLMRKDNFKPLKGIYINLHEDNHAKAVLTSKRGILFTGNLTTESFEQGFDLGVSLSPEQIADVKTFIDKLISQTKKNDTTRKEY